MKSRLNFAKSQIKRLITSKEEMRISGPALDSALISLESYALDLSKEIIDNTRSQKRKTVNDTAVTEVCQEKNFPLSDCDSVMSKSHIDKILKAHNTDEEKFSASQDAKDLFQQYFEGFVAELGLQAFRLAQADKGRKTLKPEDVSTALEKYGSTPLQTTPEVKTDDKDAFLATIKFMATLIDNEVLINKSEEVDSAIREILMAQELIPRPEPPKKEEKSKSSKSKGLGSFM